MPKLPLRLMPMAGIYMSHTTVWAVTMAMVDTMDILTTTDTVTLENALLMLNLKLRPHPRLRLLPGMDTMVDTTVILTDMDTTDIPTDMAVTGGNLTVTIPSHLV